MSAATLTSVIAAADLGERVRGNIARLVAADDRYQVEIAAAAWPETNSVSACRRLQKALGGQWPTLETLAGLCRALDVDPSELFAREPSP